MPRVSVILGTHNDEKFVRATVESILNQTYKDIEFIIINDGSTDRTREILGSITDKRMYVVNQDNMGINASRNEAIKMAKGEYVAIQDGDDISIPGKLEKQVKILDENKEIGVVGTGEVLITQDDEMLYSKYFPETNEAIQKMIMQENCFAAPSIMFRKDICKKLGGYRSIFKNAGDYDFLLRLTEVCKAYNLREVLYKYRINPNSMTIRRPDRTAAYRLLAVKLAEERRAGRDENMEKNIKKIIKKRLLKNAHGLNILARWRSANYLSRVHYRAACIAVYQGDYKKTRKFCLKSLKYNFLKTKPYFCFLLTLFPYEFIKNKVLFIFKRTAKYLKEQDGNIT